MEHLTPLSITLAGAQVLTPDGVEGCDLSIAGGKIVEASCRVVSADGCLILPGIVDLHGDGFERHLAPRRGAVQDLGEGMISVDAELAQNGITTAMLAQFMSWEGGMRGPDFAERLALALTAGTFNTDLHMQLRLEIGLAEAFDRAEALIRHFGIGYVVFNDHLPHRAIALGRRPPRLTGQALKAGRSPEEHLKVIQQLCGAFDEAMAALEPLAEKFRAMGVRLGSHDDQTSRSRETFRDLGATICEFPETLIAAEAAKAAGDFVVMGAPNVVRGGSHDKKVAAHELIEAGLVDALVSDYHYPSLRRAAFKLVKTGLSLETAWGLVSSGPARVMGWTDRGELRPGARADFVVVDAQTNEIEAVFAGGQASYVAARFASRLLEA